MQLKLPVSIDTFASLSPLFSSVMTVLSLYYHYSPSITVKLDGLATVTDKNEAISVLKEKVFTFFIYLGTTSILPTKLYDFTLWQIDNDIVLRLQIHRCIYLFPKQSNHYLASRAFVYTKAKMTTQLPWLHRHFSRWGSPQPPLDPYLKIQGYAFDSERCFQLSSSPFSNSL